MNKENPKLVQETIFKEAFLVSNFLLLWSLPPYKEKLNQEQKKAVEERLWKKNPLEALVVEKLGDEAWYKLPEERKALKKEDYQRISQLTEETKAFIRKLEENTPWKGNLDREIATNKEKTIQEWIKENKTN